MADNQELTSKELLPCPFCGGNAAFYGFTVCCNKCGVQMTANVEAIKKPTYKDGKVSAIPKWNTRTCKNTYNLQLTQTQQALDRAVEALKDVLFIANKEFEESKLYTNSRGMIICNILINQVQAALTSIKE